MNLFNLFFNTIFNGYNELMYYWYNKPLLIPFLIDIKNSCVTDVTNLCILLIASSIFIYFSANYIFFFNLQEKSIISSFTKCCYEHTMVFIPLCLNGLHIKDLEKIKQTKLTVFFFSDLKVCYNLSL